MNEIKIKISIPTDIDGFILQQCPLCEEYFKLLADDIEAEDVIEIWCPCCGLKSPDYITDDVMDLIIKMSENVAMDLICKEIKKWEKKSRGKAISIKSNIKFTENPENLIISKIDSLEIQKYDCCNRYAKMKTLVKLSGSYCPFCGGNYNGTN